MKIPFERDKYRYLRDLLDCQTVHHHNAPDKREPQRVNRPKNHVNNYQSRWSTIIIIIPDSFARLLPRSAERLNQQRPSPVVPRTKTAGLPWCWRFVRLEAAGYGAQERPHAACVRVLPPRVLSFRSPSRPTFYLFTFSSGAVFCAPATFFLFFFFFFTFPFCINCSFRF